MLQIPLIDELNAASTVLLAGAGGGFDIFSGLPLYFAIRAKGKRVVLANLSFSSLGPGAGRRITPDCVEVTADSQQRSAYFPELYLSQWFREEGEEVSIFSFERTGVAPITRAYKALVDEIKPDTIVLVDGGTDSLMRGDEAGLGTPEEDMASIAEVDAIDPRLVSRKILVCLGFGIDAFHGVCHAHVLEAVADLIRGNAYLGAISITRDMPEFKRFQQAAWYAMTRMPGRESIVTTSILSAIEGQYGNHQTTSRTSGSELYINPLMALYWGFRLPEAAKRVLYLNEIRLTETFTGLSAAIGAAVVDVKQRPRRTLPM
jgi:hypothetical protein